MRCRPSVALVFVLVACASSTRHGDHDAPTGGDDAAATDGPLDDGPDPADASEIDAAAIDAPADAAVDAAIDANNCPTQPCDIHTQCGCAPAACDIDFTDLMGTACRAVNVAGTETSRCVQNGNPQPSYCAAGYVCVGTDANARCERYCDATSDCAAPRGQCVIQLTNGPMPISGATTCSSNCNPVDSAAGGCPAGDKCGFFTVNNALTGGVDRDIVDCTTPGAGTQNATCTNDSQCASDFLCVNTGVTRCHRVCRISPAGNECASLGLICRPFAPALVVGGTTYGFCGT